MSRALGVFAGRGPETAVSPAENVGLGVPSLDDAEPDYWSLSTNELQRLARAFDARTERAASIEEEKLWQNRRRNCACVVNHRLGIG